MDIVRLKARRRIGNVQSIHIETITRAGANFTDHAPDIGLRASHGHCIATFNQQRDLGGAGGPELEAGFTVAKNWAKALRQRGSARISLRP
jgi:hypothetical protein